MTAPTPPIDRRPPADRPPARPSRRSRPPSRPGRSRRQRRDRGGARAAPRPARSSSRWAAIGAARADRVSRRVRRDRRRRGARGPPQPGLRPASSPARTSASSRRSSARSSPGGSISAGARRPAIVLAGRVEGEGAAAPRLARRPCRSGPSSASPGCSSDARLRPLTGLPRSPRLYSGPSGRGAVGREARRAHPPRTGAEPP